MSGAYLRAANDHTLQMMKERDEEKFRAETFAAQLEQETARVKKAEAALAAHHGFSANRSGWCPVCERAARRESGRLKG